MSDQPSLRDFARAQMEAAGNDALRTAATSKLERPGVDVRGEVATATLGAGDSIDDLAGLLASYGLAYDDWTVERVTANKWQSAAIVSGVPVVTTMKQLKAHLKASTARLLPQAARLDGPVFTAPRIARDPSQPKLVVQLPDQQAPYHDRGLHDLVCEWLSDYQPEVIVLSGDLFDFPSISKHRKNPKHDTTAQQSIDAGYAIIRDYRQAAWQAKEVVLLEGNHEVRLQNFLLDLGAEELGALRRAGETVDIPPVLSLRHLARLDELGVQVSESPYGSYPYPRYALSRDFDIYHGWIVRPMAGASAQVTALQLGKSVAVGHTHRAGIVTVNDPCRKMIAVEAGTLAQIEGGLGYHVSPNWENAFAAYRVYPDGGVHPSLALYRDGTLLFEGRSYRHAVPHTSASLRL